MIHGPCGELRVGSVCMVDGRCSKKYPRNFAEETMIGENGYPLYRKRDNNEQVLKGNVTLDNRWVVPYNPYLSAKFNAHINVEICTGITVVKYLYKYVYKGMDAAQIRYLEATNEEAIHWDEVRQHIDTRYVSAPEAAWRLFAFKMHDHSHAVFRLAVHLENMQQVTFRPGQENRALELAATTFTTLTAWFRLNQENGEARQYLYHDIPHHFVFNKSTGWKKRQRNTKMISRMYHCSPKDRERFYLRIILLNVRGATSFVELRTVNNIEYSTYREAAEALNLVRTDAEWELCLTEAASYKMPRQLRELFASLLVFCEITNGLTLWNKFKGDLSEDFVNSNQDHPLERTLKEIEEYLMQHGLNCTHFGLLSPNITFSSSINNEEILFRENIFPLNNEQLVIFNEVSSAVYSLNPAQTCFFLDGAAGTGKTYLYNTLLNYVRRKGDIASASAFTGIAAILLKGGTTVHSAFKLPIKTNESSCSSITPGTPIAMNVKETKLFIIDEVTMLNKHHIRMIDDILKYIMGNTKPFGGKAILFGGDFRQTLPVVKHGNRRSVIEATIKSSGQFGQLKKVTLQRNMRAGGEEEHFCNFLKQLGEGLLPRESLPENSIYLPQQCLTNKLVVEMYKNITSLNSIDYVNHAILCPKNCDTEEVNLKIIDLMDGEEKTYNSIDTIDTDENSDDDLENYPTEFLNTINPSGFPPHKLVFKKGAIVMLLRNLNTRKGLVNGTRLMITRTSDHHLEAQVVTGRASGNVVFIPRMELVEAEPSYPFKLKRRQFPLKLAFAMTINKSQGQTLDKVGLYLPNPVFSHGQLYVAFSRARRMENIKIQVSPTEEQGPDSTGRTSTKNIVWTEIL